MYNAALTGYDLVTQVLQTAVVTTIEYKLMRAKYKRCEL